MAGKRRKWQDNLRHECKTEKSPKKPKIKMLKEKVYKEQNGELVLFKSINYLKESQCGIVKEQCSDSPPPLQKENATTPHQKPSDVENITPTFRKPENYLAATADVMKEISPKLDQINMLSTSCDHITEDDKILNDLCSNIPLQILEEELIVKESDNFSICFEEHDNNNTCMTYQRQETENTLQKVNTIQNTPTKVDTLTERDEIELNSPNWAKFKFCEVEVTIERNFGSDNGSNYDGNKNAETKNSLNPNLEITDQARNEKVLEEVEDIEIDSVILTKKTINGITEQSALFSDTSDEIRAASDSDLAQSADKKSNTRGVVRRSKRKLNFDKSYLDFVDDDLDSLLLNEAFPSEESNTEFSEEESTSSSSSGEIERKKSRKDKKQKKSLKEKKKMGRNTVEKAHQIPVEKRKSKTQTKKENDIKKKKGEVYINTKGEIVEGKCIKPNPCVGVNCGNNCSNISEERRTNLFSHFWGLCSYQRRKDWITQCAIRRSVKRPSKNALLNRSQTYEYYINEGEGRRKVCQKFLIATLDVTQRFMLYTLDTMTDGFAKEDGRGKAGGHNKTSEDIINDAKKFILDLPLLPSHYCRRDSTKLYLPEEFKNVSNLYRIYKDYCADKKSMSFKVFSGWFKKSFNIGFHIPKKDKCALCVSNKSFDVKTEEDMRRLKLHENEKEESYKRFIFHQNINKRDKGTVCASFDLQKVLNTPYGESMTLYYSRKIAVYNFTIYESNTQLGICNVWTEADAKRGANEIASCLLEYIRNVDKRGNVKQVILYCDSAFGQNKNKTVLAMLRYALSISENIDTIQINYLIPGHTYMPVDSMHATIENSVKNSIVWAPSQWSTIIQFARKNPGPYIVNVLNGEDFSGFENILDNTFKKNQNVQVSKISIVTFRKKQPEKMFLKNSMLPDAEAIEVQLSALNDAIPKPKLYPSKLPICQKKYADLKKLVEKVVIPKRFAKEYLDLKTNAKVKDCLPDTDVED